MENVKYFFIEGVRSFWINGIMSLATVVIVTACLLLLGTYVIFVSNISFLTEQLQGKYEVQVYLNKETSQERISAIEKDLSDISNIQSVVFISKNERLQTALIENKESRSYEELIKNNPVRDSYGVTLKSMENWRATEQAIKQIPEVQDVSSSWDIIEKLNLLSKGVKIVCWLLMVFMSAISIFIISNTIKITVFARRRDINIMKFVGATDWFIRWPFIVEGILIGLVSAAVSIIILVQSYSFIERYVNPWFDGFIEIMPIASLAGIVSSVLIVLGVILGGVGSALSLRKHLHV